MYQDLKPVLRERSYKDESYLERVVAKIGGKCPNCGRTLQLSPTRIEVFVPSQRSVSQGAEGMFAEVRIESGLSIVVNDLE